MYRPAAVLILLFSPFWVLADEAPRWARAFPEPTQTSVIAHISTVVSEAPNAEAYKAALQALGAAVAARVPRMPTVALEDAVRFVETARRRQGLPVADGRYLRDALVRRLAESTTDEIADYRVAIDDLLATVFPSGDFVDQPSSRSAVMRDARYAIDRWYIRMITASSVSDAARLVVAVAEYVPDEAARAQMLASAYRAVDSAPPLGGPPALGEDAAASPAAYLRRFVALHPAVAEHLYITNGDVRRLLDRLSTAGRSEARSAVESGADEFGITVAELLLLERTATFVRVGAERELRVLMANAAANLDPQMRSISEAATIRLEETAVLAVEQVREYAAGSDPRSGDAYRWTILPALTNPSVDALIFDSADDDTSAAELVSGYVTDVLDQVVRAVFDRYPDAVVRVIEGPPGSNGRFVLIESASAGDPVDARVGELFYEELVTAAQGADALPLGMRSPVADGYSQAVAWAHSHGFHGMPVGPTTPGRFVGEASRAWFALASVADVAVDAAALTIRGFSALGWALDQVADAVPGVTDPFLAPDVVLTRELASDVFRGRVLPACGIAKLASLWDVTDAAAAVAELEQRVGDLADAADRWAGATP